MTIPAPVALPVEIRRADVLHFLGYRGQGIPSARVAEALGLVLQEARSRVKAQGVRVTVSPDQIAVLGLAPVPRASLALGIVTIGADLEREVSSLLSKSETTRALLLDAAGSAAAEEAADLMEGCIRAGVVTHTAGRATGRSRRFSPGYGRWPVTAQRAVFAVLSADRIGVRLLPSCLMSPRKSVSFAVWLGPGDDPDAPLECRSRRCADCDMTTCPYREPDPVES